MKKAILFMLGFVVVFIAACGGRSTTQPQDDSSANDAQFCTKSERTNIDFGVLNDVRSILARYSVFEGTAQDPELLLRSTLESVFAFLGVPDTQIPAWAHAIIDEELASASYLRPPDFSVLNDVYNELILDPQYADLEDPSRLEALVEDSIRGVIDALGDPFARYVPADLWQSGAAEGSGRYLGIGIGVKTNSRGEITISSVGDGTPAQSAKLKPEDSILVVNGLSTQQCTVRQFILQVKALSDPRLNLTIARDSLLSTERDVFEDIEVVMQEIQQVHLSTYPGIELPDGRGSTTADIPYRCNGASTVGLPCPFADEDGNGIPDILYIRIHSFSDQMENDLEYFLANTDLSLFRGVVVDVRDNPGGRVAATINTVDFFLPTSDYIYSTQNAAGTITRFRQNSVTYLDEDTPLVILVDRDSFSGAELFPAALRDNGRAIIVSRDERTGGKGTVNQYYTLRGGEYGAVYVSILLWFTPSGDIIELQEDEYGRYVSGGLSPDIRIEWSDEDISRNDRDVNYDPTLEAAIDYIESHGK